MPLRHVVKSSKPCSFELQLMELIKTLTIIANQLPYHMDYY